MMTGGGYIVNEVWKIGNYVRDRFIAFKINGLALKTFLSCALHSFSLRDFFWLPLAAGERIHH